MIPYHMLSEDYDTLEDFWNQYVCINLQRAMTDSPFSSSAMVYLLAEIIDDLLRATREILDHCHNLMDKLQDYSSAAHVDSDEGMALINYDAEL